MGLASILSHTFFLGFWRRYFPFFPSSFFSLQYLINSLKVTHPALRCLTFVSYIATTISHCFSFMSCFITYVLHSISVSVLSYLAFRRCLFYYLFSLLLLSYTIRHDLFTLSPNQQSLFRSDHSTINPSMFYVLLLPTSGIT